MPAKTIQEFVTWAKAEGDKLSYASTGNGSASNLAMELFKGATGIQAVHVPYRGSAPAVQDLLGGQVKCSFQTLPSVLAQIRAGKLRALAVSSLKRNANLPDVPTVDETVVKGFQADAWFGLFAPAGTPPTSSPASCRDDEGAERPGDGRGDRQGGLRHYPVKSRGIGRFREGRDRQVGQGGEGLRRQGGVNFRP